LPVSSIAAPTALTTFHDTADIAKLLLSLGMERSQSTG
jgi:hypothetical protein